MSPSGEVIVSTKYGCMIVPWFAMPAAVSAISRGVTWSSPWPKPVSATAGRASRKAGLEAMRLTATGRSNGTGCSKPNATA